MEGSTYKPPAFTEQCDNTLQFYFTIFFNYQDAFCTKLITSYLNQKCQIQGGLKGLKLLGPDTKIPNNDHNIACMANILCL